MRRLRNAEHFDFYDLVCIQIAGKVLQCEILLSEWNIFRGAFEKENNIYKRYVKQNYTRLVRKAHADRKRSYVGLKLLVEAALYNSSPMVQPAAEELMTVLKNHPGIYRAPMSEASAMILNLVQDIKRTKYAPSVALVGVADAIGRLNQDNENFMTLFFDRAYSKEEAKLEGRLREVRRLVDCGFARLVNMINALCQINEVQQPPNPEVSGILADIVCLVNSYIHQYETIYARRNPKYPFTTSSAQKSAPAILAETW